MRDIRLLPVLTVLLIVCAQASADGSTSVPQSTSRLCSAAANGSLSDLQFSFAHDPTMGVWRGDDTVYGNIYQAYHIVGGVDADINLDAYTTGFTEDFNYFVLREYGDCASTGVAGAASECTADDTNSASPHHKMLSNDGDAFSPASRARIATAAAPVTNATSTFSTVVTLPVPVGTLLCTALGKGTDSTGADGVKWKLNTAGLTVASTSLVLGNLINVGTPGVQDAQVSTGAAVTLTGTAIASTVARFEATLVVTVAGDLTLQSAQVAHTIGTLTSDAGASIVCQVK